MPPSPPPPSMYSFEKLTRLDEVIWLLVWYSPAPKFLEDFLLLPIRLLAALLLRPWLNPRNSRLDNAEIMTCSLLHHWLHDLLYMFVKCTNHKNIHFLGIHQKIRNISRYVDFEIFRKSIFEIGFFHHQIFGGPLKKVKFLWFLKKINFMLGRNNPSRIYQHLLPYTC